MIKRYKSNSELSFNVTVGGKRRHIVFDTFSRGGSEYSTGDEGEQQAIESLPFFGTLFYEIKETEPESTGEDECINISLEEIAGITNCADAKVFLMERGVTGSLRTKDEIKKAAREAGVEFPDWK